MKDNKLFSAMGSIDEELIDEAINANAPRKKKLPVFRITAAAAVFVFIALAATILININRQPEMIAESDTSNVQTSEKTDSTKPESKEQKNESSVSALNGDNSTKTPDTQPSKTEKQDTEGNSGYVEQPNENTTTAQNNETEPPAVSTPSEQTGKTEQSVAGTSEVQTGEQTSTVIPATEEERCDILGSVEWNGKTYMQVFNKSPYTLDKDIGRAGDFKGAYHNLNDNSRIYTVKEDENILVVKFENGGSVTLMLLDYDIQDSMGYYRFNGLRVDRSLMAALNFTDGKAYSVYVTRPDSDDMNSYAYNGKTIGDLRTELTETMKQMAIRFWITGESDGQKLVSAWGEDFMGEAEKIKEEYRIAGTDSYDIAKADEDARSFDKKYDEVYTSLQESLDAFLKEKIKAVYDILIANDIQAELINEVRCEMTITKEQFEALAATGSISEEYAFGLSSGGYATDDEPGLVSEDEPYVE